MDYWKNLDGNDVGKKTVHGRCTVELLYHVTLGSYKFLAVEPDYSLVQGAPMCHYPIPLTSAVISLFEMLTNLNSISLSWLLVWLQT